MSELDEEVAETLEFFAFSLREDANYNGKVAFVISAEEEETEYDNLARTVVVGDEVSIEDGIASDATVVRLDRRTFLDVYSGYVLVVDCAASRLTSEQVFEPEECYIGREDRCRWHAFHGGQTLLFIVRL